jgi:hypothetical protein
MVRLRQPPNRFDGIECLLLRRAARGAYLPPGRVHIHRRRGFASRWRTWGSEVLVWADSFDERHGLPPTTADCMVAAFGPPGPPYRRLRGVREDVDDDR